MIAKLISSAIRDIISISLGNNKPRKRFSKLTKQKTLIIQNFRCKKCGRFLEEVDYHHRDGNRDNNHLSNCVALCPNCHAKKTRKIIN